MKNKIVKDIIEFTLQNVDWQSEVCLDCIEDLLTEKINVVICSTNTMAVQCNDQNNTEGMASNGELSVNILLVDTTDLTTDHLMAHAISDLGVVTVSFEDQW
jgi:hypothetical protein